MLTSQMQPWTLVRKVSFRFIFAFFVLNMLPVPLVMFSAFKEMIVAYNDLWTPIVNWVGGNVLQIETEIINNENGSGDHLFDYVKQFTFLLISFVVMVVWSVLDRHRSSYYKLDRWFLMVLSIWAGTIAIGYGWVKVFPLQFVKPFYTTLLQTYGQSSPMHLMWTFMGASETYTMFAGYCEAIAGVLLLIRRTRTLGALMLIGVMLNVFMMNMSYDVPVKIFSFTVMLAGLVIAFHDYRRLLQFFVLDQEAPRAVEVQLASSGRANKIVIAVYLLVVGLAVWDQVNVTNKMTEQFFAKTAYPIEGIYEAVSFERAGVEVPPLITDTERWRYLVVEGFAGRMTAVIKPMDNSMIPHMAAIDTIQNELSLTNYRDSSSVYKFEYAVSADSLHLVGMMESDTVKIAFRHFTREDFLLENRGFHWVNEFPYNRYDYSAPIR